MSKSSDRKLKQLGMPIGTASHRLRKLVMLDLLRQLDKDTCYKCGEKIRSAAELSIEHKEPWLGVSTALFWDLDNIAFSHRGCNKADRPNLFLRKVGPPGTAWCTSCQQFLPESQFYKDKSRWTGLRNKCKECARNYRREKARLAKKNRKPKVCLDCGAAEGEKAFRKNRRLCRECYNVRQSKLMRERRARDKNKNRKYDSITGEKNRLAKLTEEKVKEIRLLYSLGALSQGKLADMFGVKKSTIRHVLGWDTWKHVEW